MRDFTNELAPFVDINHLSTFSDHQLFLTNEIQNTKRRYPNVETEDRITKAIIVSDGYQFDSKQQLLASLPNDVVVISTNKSLANWKLMGSNSKTKRVISYYVVNNPYSEAKFFLPKDYFPKCVASSRTNPSFLKGYRGNIFLYSPVKNSDYSGVHRGIDFELDDYRNPICSAIGLAYRLGVQQLMLFCCDDSFEKERPSSVQLDNGLWAYPQQLLSHELIDSNLFWLKKQQIKIGNHSSSPKFKNAEYINEEGLSDFFGK